MRDKHFGLASSMRLHFNSYSDLFRNHYLHLNQYLVSLCKRQQKQANSDRCGSGHFSLPKLGGRSTFIGLASLKALRTQFNSMKEFS